MTVDLLAGLDMSTKQGKVYLGGIVGLKESITSTHKRLGYDQLHMREKGVKTKDHILDKIKFNLAHSFLFCIRIDRGVIIDENMKSRHVKHSTIKRRDLEIRFDQDVYAYICEKILPFLHKYRTGVTDLSFECDSDCKNLVRRNGGRQIKPGIAHDLADIIAWSFTRGRGLKTAEYYDKTDELRHKSVNFIRKL